MSGRTTPRVAVITIYETKITRVEQWKELLLGTNTLHALNAPALHQQQYVRAFATTSRKSRRKTFLPS